ncbi:DNA replication/repair protein RecF [Crassaminicella thermophila]|uniref:DNA replication and repair protein RecF n=1 Tax=Crassaminicella thermophila TaxID=2599308 RepID=A0A5C0SAY9_CRATE|nr:DNA replication/repair protein RecF [Crassaminicella thermophila]QEK10886.1 DNA replication/repair protein RecF [Crassaminicella thermophila]
MYLESLKLINFRNYNQLQLKFHPKLNVFVGNNAQGKTNILEAIYLTSTGKSFRTNKDRELIKFDKEQAYIKVEGKKRYTDTVVELKLEENKKKQIKVNGVTLSKNTDILNNVYVVVFSPEDLKLIKEGPSERRKFMDDEISQMKPSYFHYLTQYNRVLLQRNNLLKKIHHHKKYMDTLDIWNEKIIEIGTRIIIERAKFVTRIAPLSRLIHRKITENKENLEVKYISNIQLNNTFEETLESFRSRLKESLEVDLQRGTTTVGPHRDDLGVFVNGIDIRSFGSQGQQRTCALSLKLAEIELIKGETSEYPILLLDDVMSELDINRQKFLIKALRDVQIFITTTEREHLNDLNVDKEYVFYVKNAIVRKEKIESV